MQLPRRSPPHPCSGCCALLPAAAVAVAVAGKVAEPVDAAVVVPARQWSASEREQQLVDNESVAEVAQRIGSRNKCPISMLNCQQPKRRTDFYLSVQVAQKLQLPGLSLLRPA